MRGCILEILTAGLLFMLYALILSSFVVGLAGGIADIIYHSRAIDSRQQADESHDAPDFTPNLISGILCILMSSVTVMLGVRMFGQRMDLFSHVLLIILTVLAAAVLLLPRPSMGTSTEGMKQVFGYLTLLGVLESALYGTYVRRDPEAPVQRLGSPD
jgi:H+/Cl- antiporter ClcA